MHVASVTLDEVLRAAVGRAAALVPETAGYLALAIGDASARLPYRIDDDMVTLTTEGTVRVARGKTGVSPEEGARVLRDHLRRLLSVSAGTMPGLAQAGTPRAERSGPESVIAEIEAALIPVNRAAARRSLARLARDAAKARDQGRMARRAPPMQEVPGARPAPIQAQAYAAPAHQEPPRAPEASYGPAPAQPVAYAPAPSATFAAPPAHGRGDEGTTKDAFEAFEVDVVFEAEPETPAHIFVPQASQDTWSQLEEPTCRIAVPVSSPVARPTWVADPTLPVDPGATAREATSCQENADGVADGEMASHGAFDLELHDPTILDPDVLGVVEAQRRDWTPRLGTPAPHAVLAAVPAPAAPREVPAPQVQEPTAVDAAALALADHLRSGRLGTAAPMARAAAPRQRRQIWQAELQNASHSDLDALLATFRPSSPAEEATTMRRDLKKLVGIDATQLPPRVADRAGTT